MESFNKLSKEIYLNNVKNGWDGDNFLVNICLIHTEISEAVEDYRNNKQITELEFIKDKNNNFKPIGIPSELADIVIRVLDVCGRYNIDIETAIRKKIDYNTTRGYKHGGKKV